MKGIQRGQLVNMNQHYRRFSLDYFLDCQLHRAAQTGYICPGKRIHGNNTVRLQFIAQCFYLNGAFYLKSGYT